MPRRFNSARAGAVRSGFGSSTAEAKYVSAAGKRARIDSGPIAYRHMQLDKEYPVVISQNVVWGDMDAFQHINNTVYFRYFENVRLAYLERIGYMESMESTGLGIILAETRCRYLLPLTYPDTVRTGTRLLAIDDDRFRMEYAVFSEGEQKLAAIGEGLIVSYDYRRAQKAPIPQAIRQRMMAIQPHTGED